MTIQSYRDLRVWQVGMDLVESVYRLSADFPAREVYGLAGQMRRAAVSIPSNIAEGHTRESTREYLYHLSIAQGSLAELQTQIEVAGRLVYLAPEQVSAVLDRRSISRSNSTLCGTPCKGKTVPNSQPLSPHSY